MSDPASPAGPAISSLVLGSSSPRRRDLLGQIGVVPNRIVSPDIDETPHIGEIPRLYALRLAIAKAEAVVREAGEIVLSGDTTVAVGRCILPQAQHVDDVTRFLRLMSGRRHHVWSAVAVIDGDGRVRSRVVDTVVRFKRLTPDEIAAYAGSGEGIGKAGGYAIQGRAAALIDFLQGSYSAVVGLPLFEVRALLRASGYPVD